MQIMKDIPEITEVVIPAKTVAEQILEAPIGSVFAETVRTHLHNERIPYKTVTRTGETGWWATGESGYWSADDIKRWVRNNPRTIVALHIAP